MLVITKDNFKKEVEEYRGLVVIDLYADWCGPCKMMAPILSELEAELPEVRFAKINVDNEPELAAAFKVTSIPMIAIVENDTFLDFSVGYRTKQSLLEFINQYK